MDRTRLKISLQSVATQRTTLKLFPQPHTKRRRGHHRCRAFSEPHANFPPHPTSSLHIPPNTQAPARPRSGWSNKTGSVLQLPGLLWEPTPKRPKRLIEPFKTIPIFSHSAKARAPSLPSDFRIPLSLPYQTHQCLPHIPQTPKRRRVPGVGGAIRRAAFSSCLAYCGNPLQSVRSD